MFLAGCGGPTKRCLVSALSGTILANGTPVHGATVTRRYYSHWYNNHVESTTHTDTAGNFTFDAVWKSAVADIMHEPVVEEEVVVERDGKTYIILNINKRNYDLLGELDAVRFATEGPDKDRFTKQDGTLCLKYVLDADNDPIGKQR
jgi:hypothetical protein